MKYLKIFRKYNVTPTRMLTHTEPRSKYPFATLSVTSESLSVTKDFVSIGQSILRIFVVLSADWTTPEQPRG